MVKKKAGSEGQESFLGATLHVLKPNQQTWALLALLVVVVALFSVLAYLCWYRALPWIWGDWALTGQDAWWKAFKIVAAGFASIYLAFIPLLPVFIVRSALPSVFKAYLRDRTQQKIDDINEQQRSVEDELLKGDDSGLIQLVRYSRLQLQAYYAISMGQTKKSFRYSVLAMWIGFAVIIAGVAIYEFPYSIDLPFLKRNTAPQDGGLHILTIASGTVIEVVSALFLWVYSRTMKQLTYFYDRQSYNHLVAMCARIADTMKTGADETKKVIVEKAMVYSWALPEDKLPGLAGLGRSDSRKGKS